MKAIMTAATLLERASQAARSNTLYVKGGWGQLATAKNKARAIAQYKYNAERKDKINAAPYKTWFFDCLCFIKAILWGWSCSYGSSNGGAVYCSNDIPDCTEQGLLTMCGSNIWPFSDKRNLVPGSLLYMKGHVGLYAGENKVIECAPSLGGVKITELTYQHWEKYGLLECIQYKEIPTPAPAPVEFTKGTKVALANAPLYASYDAKKPANHVTGFFYLSDGKNFSGRYRICKEKMYCGLINKVWGYVNRKDCKPCAR